MNIETRQLRHFVAVADTLHFGRAAARLGITQPPLSQSIRALEGRLGAALFTRTNRNVQLTAFGAQWLVHVRAALAEVTALGEVARRLRDGETGPLELSFVSTADYSVLPALVRGFGAVWPDVELALTEATSDVQIAALLAGRGHAGIIIPPDREPVPEPLVYRPLMTEPLVAAVPEGWIESRRIVPRRGRLTARQILDSPLIVFPRPHAPAFHDRVVDFYVSRGGHPRIAQHAIQMQTIISLVSAGLGVALVPQSLRRLARTGVRYLDLPGEAPELETGLIWRRDDPSPTLARFLDVAEAGGV